MLGKLCSYSCDFIQNQDISTKLGAAVMPVQIYLAGYVVSFDSSAYGTFCVLGFAIAKVFERVLGKDVIQHDGHTWAGIVVGFAITKTFYDLTFSEFLKTSAAICLVSPIAIIVGAVILATSEVIDYYKKSTQ